MGRAKWLQETRMARFEEALDSWTEKRLTQEEAAALLGVCPRTFRRYVDHCAAVAGCARSPHPVVRLMP